MPLGYGNSVVLNGVELLLRFCDSKSESRPAGKREVLGGLQIVGGFK